jgi:hypothetical protein
VIPPPPERPFGRRALAALLLLLLWSTACARNAGGALDARAWDVSLRVPGDAVYAMSGAPDGALFVSTFGGAVYRRVSPGAPWTRVVPPHAEAGADAPLLQIGAPSGRAFFAIAGSGLYRWDEAGGLRREGAPVTDSTASGCAHLLGAAALQAIWAPSEGEAYAAGRNGVVLHFDGTRWVRERTPLGASVPPRCDAVPGADLLGVGGSPAGVYAAGARVIRRTAAGVWELSSGPGVGRARAETFAMASPPGAAPLFGVAVIAPGSEMVDRYAFYRPGGPGRPWTRVAEAPPRELLDLAWGATTPGGGAFWGHANVVVVVDHGKSRLVRLPLSRPVRGVAVAGGRMYVATNAGDTALVLALRR